LDLAAIVRPADEPVRPWDASTVLMEQVFRSVGLTGTSFSEALGLDASPEGLFFWSCRKFPELFRPTPGEWPVHTRESAARIVYNLFFEVRSVLDTVVDAKLVPNLLSGESEWWIWIKHSETAPTRAISVSRLETLSICDGKAHFDENREWMRFKAALESAEIDRLRRCPVCQRIYYAVRKNKGACDLHLNSVRVRRNRDLKKHRQYEETRKVNRLIKTGLPLDRARAIVEARARKKDR